MKSLSLAVSEFAVPSPRTGSIEAYSGYGGLPNVGAALHLEIQMARIKEHPGYTPEKWISSTFQHDGHSIAVGGRMDGFVFDRPCLIEEIKSAYNPEELLRALEKNPHHPYKLQLRTYGYMHWLNTAQEPTLNLHVVNARTRHGLDIPLALDVDDYEAWLERRLGELVREQKDFAALHGRRKKLAKTLNFPFAEPRPGQKELIETIRGRLNGKARVLLQAPTGLGKTAGVLFPVLQDSLKRGHKTIYLTAKNSQHEVAEDAVKRLQEAGAKVRAVTIHAKHKMCLKEEPFCSPEYCEYARGHYDKFSARDVRGQLAKKKRLTAATFKKIGRESEVCPFEIQFEAAPLADVIIGDYNYVFSPRNSSGRLMHNGWQESKSLPNVVIDEAHNLPSRATDYFSAALSSDEVRDLCRQVPDEVSLTAHGVLEALRGLILTLSAEEGLSRPRQIQLESAQLFGLQARALELQSRYLESSLELKTNDPVLRLTSLVGDFVQAQAASDDEFFATLTPSPSGGTLKLTCCDASPWLTQCYANFANVVAFSATLKPFDYYTQLLGLTSDELLTAEFESPFPREHRKFMVIPQISTKMRDRESNYGKIKQSIERIVQIKPGNYFVFFPSFDFLHRVRALVDLPDFRVLVQQRDMRREDVAGYLEALRENTPTVIFAVQGGVFAEGVDYPGDMLIGALIVGPALPTFDFERELRRQHFDRKHGHGFDYAYTYPAMARVVQSAGRVIRSMTDRGLIVLMDRRFLEEGYRKSMPREWVEDEHAVSQTILADVRRFWEGN